MDHNKQSYHQPGEPLLHTAFVVGAREGAPSIARRPVLCQRAGDDGFAIWVRTVEKSAESESVRTGCVGSHETLREFSYVANPGCSAVVADRRSPLGSGLRERRPVI
jgi:hypothetical protein